jgi:hypothetical protein
MAYTSPWERLHDALEPNIQHPVELSFFEGRVIRRKPPVTGSVPPRPGDQSVERHRHRQYQFSHKYLFQEPEYMGEALLFPMQHARVFSHVL